MRLFHLKIDQAPSCAGLFDGLDVSFAQAENDNINSFNPLCLLGPNGSGKSQFLQLLAEIFQTAWHLHSPDEERSTTNKDALFELEYTVADKDSNPVRVRLSRGKHGRTIEPVRMAILLNDDWSLIPPNDPLFGLHLPSIVIGYTSGENETLSLPFLISRSGYATDVRNAALDETKKSTTVKENRLLMIDYGTHLEVLVANLILGKPDARHAILKHAELDQLASCRCIIQLNHSAAPKGQGKAGRRKGIQLTDELENHIDFLRRSATCWSYDPRTETYILDYFVDDACRNAFASFYDFAGALYRAFHKLALLNDLTIPKKSRERLQKEIDDRRFASRLPEPQDEDKVFRFEQVRLYPRFEQDSPQPVDYVSLSDGEHQQAQIFGVFAMISQSNALFLLDEPESHFNPQWRVKFVKRLLDIPGCEHAAQEVLLTTHAPFVPSDMQREYILIFGKTDGRVHIRRPDIETYGTTFDRILEHCFDVKPPISQLARDEIGYLMESGSIQEIEDAISRLGGSVEKAFLADRLRELKKISR